MSKKQASIIPEIVRKHETELKNEWVEEQLKSLSKRVKLNEHELRDQSGEFLKRLGEALPSGNFDFKGPEWAGMKELLDTISRLRAERGATPTEIAVFIFSFKRLLFERLRAELSIEPARLADEIWTATELLDQLGLYTTEVYQNNRNAVIRRQQQELLELSTPVVRLWKGILALPLIGTLDSARTQIVMESLLRELMETESSIAIIDITGVPAVDTLVAQHLMKTIAAARLMGADCFISGIRPQIAQTIVHLGVALPDVVTKASLADAFTLALRRLGISLTSSDKKAAGV